MLIKTIAGIAVFALIGAAVGYSKILCINGDCPITGSSYGGALFGGVLGLAVMSGLSNRITPQSLKQQDESQDEPRD